MATSGSQRGIPLEWLPPDKRLVLVTANRQIIRRTAGRRVQAVRALADRIDDVFIVVPVHMNPAVRETTYRILDGHPRIALISPVEYPTFTQLMKRAVLILSDSGACRRRRRRSCPVLVIREHTDRPEAIEVGAARLVGTDPAVILQAAAHLLDDEGRSMRDDPWRLSIRGRPRVGADRLRLAERTARLASRIGRVDSAQLVEAKHDRRAHSGTDRRPVRVQLQPHLLVLDEDHQTVGTAGRGGQ